MQTEELRTRARQVAKDLDGQLVAVLMARGGQVRGVLLDRLVHEGLLERRNFNRWNRTPLGEAVRQELTHADC